MDNNNLFPFENLENEELLPVTLDVVFKEIFGQEDSKPILRSFLNATLDLGIKMPEQIELLNPEINPEHLKDKKCILDIKVRLPDKTSIDVEIQVTNQYNMDKRSIYYVSKLCSDQLNSGDTYTELRPSIGLNILCYNMFDDDRYHRRFVLKDNSTNEVLSDLIRIEFLEINKALQTISTKDKTQELNINALTEVELWSLFIGSRNKEVLEMVATQNTAIKDAYSRLQRISEDDKKRAQAISREKALRDWNSSISASYNAGMTAGMAAGVAAGKADGMKEGRNQAIASAIHSMHSRNLSTDKILDELVALFQLTPAEALEALENAL